MKKDILEKAYSYYYRPLFLYAYALSKNKEDAEDLVENAFIKAMISYDDGNLKAWLYMVVKNEYYNLYKKRKKLIDEGKIVLENFEDKQDVLNELIDNEKKQWLYEQIYKLETKEREVMLLSIQSDLKDKDIAKIMNLSSENIRIIKYRVKKKLMKLCEEDYHERT